MVNFPSLRRLYDFDDSDIRDSKAAAAGFSLENCKLHKAAAYRTPFISHIILRVKRKPIVEITHNDSTIFVLIWICCRFAHFATLLATNT